MIILFHCLGILIFQLLRNRKRIKFLQRIEEDKIRLEASVDHVDLEYNLKFDPPVFRQRYGKVFETLLDERWRKQIKTLVDFGCAEFGLFVFIKRLNSLNSITFVDIDEDLLTEHSWKLHPLTIEYLKRREQPLDVSIFAGSVADPDYRLLKLDTVTAIELIEHLYPDVLDAFPYNIFSFIEPKIVIVTTPNADFNVLFSDDSTRFRHYDHKFEWTREQFEDWANNITVRFPDYSVSFSGIGEGPEGTENLGHCSQMAVFVRKDILDDKHISTVYGSPCLCDSDSTCKGTTAESKLLCKCVCALCTPSASFGVCTYYSYSKQIISYETEEEDKQFLSYNIYYKFIKRIEYPFEYDERTEEQKLLDEFQYRISTFGQAWSRFYVEERERSEIPLKDLIYWDGGLITESELHKLLSKSGYRIEECRIQETGLFEQCVIYSPSMGEVSSPSEASGYDSDIEKYPLNEESLSDWDDLCDKKDSSRPTESHQSSKDQATHDGFPNWLLQILGAQAVQEEVTPPGSQEGSHFYCQGDGLGVHPSVIAVEVDEDEDETTESSNNTADYGEAEQGSSQDMASLPEDSQTNTQDPEEVTEEDENARLTPSENDQFDPGSDLGTNQND